MKYQIYKHKVPLKPIDLKVLRELIVKKSSIMSPNTE